MRRMDEIQQTREVKNVEIWRGQKPVDRDMMMETKPLISTQMVYDFSYKTRSKRRKEAFTLSLRRCVHSLLQEVGVYVYCMCIVLYQ